MPIIRKQLFGKDIEIDFSSCDGLGNPAHDCRVYATITNNCPHNCPFCFVHSNDKTSPQPITEIWNFDKFYTAINELHKVFPVYSMNVTGGEPLIKIPETLKVLSLTKQIDRRIYTTINTSGVFMDILKQYSLNDIDSITISRHHYDEKINAKMFGHEGCEIIPNNSTLKQFIQNMYNVDLTCNLSAEGIRGEDEVVKYCEFSDQFNIHGIGFVGLMPANNYCRANVIDFTTFDFSKYDNIIQTKNQRNGDKCNCQNYAFISDNGNIIKFYHKHKLVPFTNKDRIFVFDGEFLRQGFGGEIIF